MMSPGTLKLIGLGVGILALIGLVLGLKHFKSLADERGAKLATICQTTRTASGHPKLSCADVPAQITFMGEAMTALSNALKTQNAAVKVLGDETARQQQEAAQASRNAATRARGAEATSQRLAVSSRSGGPPCEPSKALQGAWR